MEDPLQRLAALASTLKEAELRTLLELTARAARAESNNTTASSRELAPATKLSRPNVQHAIDQLAERGLLTSDGGSATRASTYHLNFLETAVLEVRGRGITSEPPQAEKSNGSGFIAEPPAALFQSQGGIEAEPGEASQQSQGGSTIEPPILRAREPIDSDAQHAIDRLLKANPKKYDAGKLMIARQWLHGYAAKFGRMPNPHPPDEQICAQFVSIAEWPRLQGMLYDLMAERREPGDSYAWFVTVALQRIWGITPQRQKEVRAQLKLVSGPSAGELKAAIASAANQKRMGFSR